MAKENFNEYSYVEEYQGSYIWFILIIATVLLLFIIIGLAYSFYNYTIRGTKQPVDTDIVFNYSDVNGSGNGISIEDAKEMSDAIGKKLTGLGNSFEFIVSGNTRKRPIHYTIVLQTDVHSTLQDSDIKVYLARVQGSTETEILEKVPTYKELEDVIIEGNSYKKLYSVDLDATDANFSHEYVLRMWIREGAEDYYGKRYSLKVNVLAEGEGE